MRNPKLEHILVTVKHIRVLLITLKSLLKAKALCYDLRLIAPSSCDYLTPKLTVYDKYFEKYVYTLTFLTNIIIKTWSMIISQVTTTRPNAITASGICLNKIYILN